MACSFHSKNAYLDCRFGLLSGLVAILVGCGNSDSSQLLAPTVPSSAAGARSETLGSSGAPGDSGLAVKLTGGTGAGAAAIDTSELASDRNASVPPSGKATDGSRAPSGATAANDNSASGGASAATTTGGANTSGGSAAGGSTTAALLAAGGTRLSSGGSGNAVPTGGVAPGNGIVASGGTKATADTSKTGGSAPTGGTSNTGGASTASGGASLGGAPPKTATGTGSGGIAATGGKSGVGGTGGGTGGSQNGPAATGGGPGAATGVAAEFVVAHNAVRAAVEKPANYPTGQTWEALPPVTWSNTVAATAQAWADTLSRQYGCQLQHATDTGYGENLAAGQGLTPKEAVDLWASEKSSYSYTPSYQFVAGHYTQLVWRASVEIGCGSATCSNGQVIVCCRYSPPGNAIGKQPY